MCVCASVFLVLSGLLSDFNCFFFFFCALMHAVTRSSIPGSVQIFRDLTAFEGEGER